MLVVVVVSVTVDVFAVVDVFMLVVVDVVVFVLVDVFVTVIVFGIVVVVVIVFVIVVVLVLAIVFVVVNVFLPRPICRSVYDMSTAMNRPPKPVISEPAGINPGRPAAYSRVAGPPILHTQYPIRYTPYPTPPTHKKSPRPSGRGRRHQ